MSGSKKKYQRKNQRNSGFDLGTSKEQEAELAKRKQTRTAVITLCAIAVVAVLVLFMNSGSFYRMMPALNVDGQRFSVADMNFYLAMVGPAGTEEDAIEAATQSTLLHRRAVEEGLALDDAARAQVATHLDFIAEQAESHGVRVNYFLAFNYGRGVNWQVVERRLEFDALGEMYERLYQERLHETYTEDMLETYYMEHRDDYDRVLFRVLDITFDATGEGGLSMEDAAELAEGLYEVTIGTMPLGGEVEPEPGPAEAEDMEDAEDPEYETAVTLPAEIEDEDENEAEADESAEADEDDEDLDTEPEAEAPTAEEPIDDSPEARETRFNAGAAGMGHAETQTLRNQTRAEVFSLEYASWLLDDNREPGDVTIFEGNETVSVLYFVGLDDNRFHAANVRHILVSSEVNFFDEGGEILAEFLDEDGEVDMGRIEAAQTEAAAAAEERAEDILAQWQADGATEDAFIDLVREYSDDNWQMNRSPGLFEEIGRNATLVPEFLDWSIDETRQPGDTAVIQTQFGAHVMYFVDWNEELYHRHVLAQWDKAAEDFQAWIEEATEDLDGRPTFFFRLTAPAPAALQQQQPALW